MTKSAKAWLKLLSQAKRTLHVGAYREFFAWWKMTCPFGCIEWLRIRGRLK